MARWSTILLTLTALAQAPVLGQQPTSVDYASEVKPILKAHCFECHGPIEAKAGLRLDSYPLILQGSEISPIIEPLKPSESVLIEVLEGSAGTRMPPKGDPLDPASIALIARWIEQGATGPTDEQPFDPTRHWSFQPPLRPPVPTAAGAGWAHNPIDRFLAVEHERHGLTPAPEADRATLLRRVHLDLTGLSPTRDELHAFLNDKSPDAYQRLVDRLLDSPAYGERWGRHWMDIWRYSDWYGFGEEVRASQPHIWRWRDWIIKSLNADTPYDHMLTAMLAADEASPGDQQALAATGYLVRPWYKFNRNVWLESAVEHTAKGFLGLTLNCAKCHDHKYDPIPQEDFYRFRAVFEPYQIRTDTVPGQPDTKKDGLVHIYDDASQTPTYLFERGDEAHPAQDKPLPPGVPQLFQTELTPQPIDLPAPSYYPGLLDHVRAQAIDAAREQVAQAHRDAPDTSKAEGGNELAALAIRAAEAALASVQARLAADQSRYSQPVSMDQVDRLSRLASRRQRAAEALSAELTLARAEQALAALLKEPAPEAAKREAAEKEVATARLALTAARQALEPDTPDYAPLTPLYPDQSTGRRLALARWITSRQNPLTARVAVNHVWMRHFGTPLVPTVFDFGINGKPPTHPALLDWLAVEFMDHDWSMKHLHRLIVTSAAYRMQSSPTPTDSAAGNPDPTNTDYAHMNPRRMEGELVRDNVLHAAGSLDTTMGGPELDQKSDLTSPRRSLYFRHAAEKQSLFMKLFDGANVNACYRRDESVVPQQALALANNPLVIDQSRLLAPKLAATASDDAAFVDAAFETILGRLPHDPERAACLAFLTAQTQMLATPARLQPFESGDAPRIPAPADSQTRARAGLIQVLFNHNDFVTIR